ncbi:MAG: sigma-70 family RNA polymerase sigma factor [Lachnospiraceae bacterium]|nr:sigma-70 family RNA polymerase sigma factor [Lachnospiraceae bacterium]
MEIIEFQKQKIEDVVFAAQVGDDAAMEYVLAKYKGLVRVLSRSLFLVDGDEDDLIQEGMIGLYKAVVGYEPNRGAAFETFAGQCINRQLYSAVKKSNRKKNIPLNSYISIDSTEEDSDGNQVEPLMVLDRISIKAQQNPEDIVIGREEAGSMERRLLGRLSEMERQVLSLFLQGLTYQEIATRLCKQPKAIDNALQRIKMKVRGLL